jgi:hypothetical protein
MPFQFTNTELIVAAIALVVVVLAIGFELQRRKTKTTTLRSRFGSEYDRAVVEHGSAHKAEAKLAGRETHVDTLSIRELGATERERFVAEWQGVQSRFVDHPKTAVTEADELVASLLEARGYPKDTFEQRAADVSVSHPHVMQGYRVAHAIAGRAYPAEASTEELRTAMIQFRAIFEELVQVQAPLEKRPAA